MRVRALVCLALLSAAGAMAATSGFLLGLDYSEWFVPEVMQIATDGSGALYILSATNGATGGVVTKMSLDAKTILWQNNLGFRAATMAVDPNGGVYVIPEWLPGDTSISVAKLAASGTGLAWKTTVGLFLPAYPFALAADSQGRAYVAGVLDAANRQAGVFRLTATGTAVDYAAHVTGVPASIAVDASGAAYIAGYVPAPVGAASFLARLAPDGSAGFYSSTLPASSNIDAATVMVDANGNAVVAYVNAAESGALQRFDSNGVIKFSNAISLASLNAFPTLALDAAGNAYLMGYAPGLGVARNSLAPCVGNLLSVFAPDGSLLQTTYIPGALGVAPLIATGANSTVFVSSSAGATFAPSEAGPFAATTSSTSVVWRLSPNADAQTFPLACLGNAASFNIGAVAPGEIVTLLGNGLGPQQGVRAQASLQSPFPTLLANVEATFDGKPAPLLWVQDGQINLVAPWSLTPGLSTEICVAYNNVKTNCLVWPVAQTAPGVFTVDGVYAAALNQDGTVNSAGNPALRGSIVTVFATGLGPIAPPQADGSLVGPGLPLPTNVLPVGVEAIPTNEPIGNIWAPIQLDVAYAGPAPDLIAGASQISFRVVPYDNGSPTGGQIYLTLPSSSSQGFQVYVAAQ
ncbi:MAG: hypothetical protein WBL61_13360 [Bryobacteraceae bacterium]